jgi:hypothetical protein
LYVGTENGVYFTTDDGQHWLPLQSGLPHAPVHWLTIQEHFNDLVIATYGRGFWVLDDITPIRQLTPQATAAAAHLFALRPAYRFRPITEPMMMPDDAAEGHNPPEGADINFLLKSAPEKDADGTTKEDAVRIVISDGGGKIVRTLKVGKTASAGLNRVWWDLRYDATKEIKLRTPPQHASDFKLGADGTRPFPLGGTYSGLVPPGTYTVKLVANGGEVSEPLIVRKDPNTAGTEADIQAQTKVLTDIRGNMSTAADLVNQAESIRAQIAQLKTLVGDTESGKAIAANADSLDKQIVAVESRLFNVTATGRGQDFLRMPSQLIEKLQHLADVVALGDFPPTDQAIEVQAKLSKDLSGYREQMMRIVNQDVATFNATLRQRNLGGIVTGQ